MARCSFSAVVLLGFLAAGSGTSSTATGGCLQAPALAAELAASCAATPPCCERVVAAAAELGDDACFCAVASETPVLHAGLDASALLALYTGCGGARRPIPACHGPAPSVHVARALPSAAAARPQQGSVVALGAAEPADAASGSGAPPAPPAEPELDVVHIPASLKTMFIALAVFAMIEIAATLGYMAYKVYRHFWAST